MCAVHIDCKENCITLFSPGKEKQEGQKVPQNPASKQQERPERDFKTDLQQNCTSPPLQPCVCCLQTLCLPVFLSLRTKVSSCGHRRRLQARSTVPPPALSCDVRKRQHQHRQHLHPRQSLHRSCAYPHAVDQFWPDDPRTARDITARQHRERKSINASIVDLLSSRSEPDDISMIFFAQVWRFANAIVDTSGGGGGGYMNAFWERANHCNSCTKNRCSCSCVLRSLVRRLMRVCRLNAVQLHLCLGHLSAVHCHRGRKRTSSVRWCSISLLSILTFITMSTITIKTGRSIIAAAAAFMMSVTFMSSTFLFLVLVTVLTTMMLLVVLLMMLLMMVLLAIVVWVGVRTMMLLVMLVMRHRLLEERHKERKIQMFKQKSQF